MRSLVAMVVVSSLVPTAAAGETISIPLPGLVGEIDFISGRSKRVAIDFGQEFSEISGVWIEIEAEETALEFDVCGTYLDPQPCVRKIWLLGLWSLIHDTASPPGGLAYSEGLVFADGSSLTHAYGIDEQPFTPFFYSWDFLLSGKGVLSLTWNNRYGDPDRIIRNVIEPTGEVFSAWLTIEGTPVPEPATALLHASAFLVLIGLRCRVREPRSP